jgi:hypothetical protein
MRKFVQACAGFGCLLWLMGCGAGAGGTSESNGANGDAGQSGELGEAGAPTTAATPGKDGRDGKDGSNGVDGKDGTNGADGKDGADGTNGANGADGVNGTNGANGTDGANGVPGKSSLVRSSHELAGDNCAYAGVRVESGLDQNGDGSLSDDEVNAAQTQFLCNAEIAWNELAALPTVSNAYSFALAANDQDGSARLGFMFQDVAYRQQLGSALWDNGGAYSGNQVFAVYKLAGDTGKTWTLSEGRVTPQTYQYSELTFNAGVSYYTTTYPSFGGLISVVKAAKYGAYALTPAFTNRKSHSVGFLNGQLFALIAQKNAASPAPAIGLTLSTFPIASLDAATFSNLWTNLSTLETDSAAISDPTLLAAGDSLVAAYIRAGQAYVRATQAPQSVAQASDYPIFGQVDDAVHLSLAWDGSKLYLASVSSAGVLTVQRRTLSDGASWETLATHVTGVVTDFSLAGKANSVLLGVRQGGALRVYLTPTDAVPSFDAVLPGNFSLLNAAAGPTLAIVDLGATATHTLRSFVH